MIGIVCKKEISSRWTEITFRFSKLECRHFASFICIIGVFHSLLICHRKLVRGLMCCVYACVMLNLFLAYQLT